MFYNNFKVLPSSCRSLDVNKLNRAGTLSPDYWGGWRWFNQDETTATIGLRMDGTRLALKYRYRAYGGPWQDVEQPVAITWPPYRYGGRRPYFICRCGRRVTKLFGAGRLFLCRGCYGLAYTSQRERGMDRALTKANRIRMRLGGDPGMASSFPDKPKGMHWRTYDRLMQNVADAEDVANVHMVRFVNQLRARVG